MNIFVQIGLVVLVGLACKNSILIVEFAKRLHQEGQPRREATQEASRLRLRPILMTSLAFILGVVPLVFASGAGAEMRRSLGTAVFSGMFGVTLFGIFLTPVFFYVIEGSARRGCSQSPPCSGSAPSCWRGLARTGPRAVLVENLSRRIRTSRESSDGSAGRPARTVRCRESAARMATLTCQGHCRPRNERGDPLAMISHFFIDRPIFASVLSIVFVLAGGVAVFTLPGGAVPRGHPAHGAGDGHYPGANAQTVRDTVAAPIEEQVSGVEGMIYMSSQCDQRRHLPPDGHLQAGHGLRHGPGAGAKPRVAGAAGHSAAWCRTRASRSRRCRPTR